MPKGCDPFFGSLARFGRRGLACGEAGLARLGKTNEMGRDMRIPTDDEIMRALCCGGKCAVGPNTGYCHRWDFTCEAARIRALLDQYGEMPTCMDRSSEPEEA